MVSFTSFKFLLICTTLLGLAKSSTLPAGHLFSRQSTTPDGTCGVIESGAGRGYRCPTTYSTCCSKWGWCGDSTDHCGMPNNPCKNTPISLQYIGVKTDLLTNCQRGWLSVCLWVLHWDWRGLKPYPNPNPTCRRPPSAWQCPIRAGYY